MSRIYTYYKRVLITMFIIFIVALFLHLLIDFIVVVVMKSQKE